jgi:peptide/nickel transport system permease protein
MGTFITRRLLIAVPILLGISLLGFTALALSGGDPVTRQIAPETRLHMTPEQIEAVRQEMGLDGPIYVRYVRWLVGVLQGDLGYSISTGRPVLEEIGARVGPTVTLIGASLLVSLLIGIPLGVLAAYHHHRALDSVLSGLSLLTISLPTFVLGLLFIDFFGITLGILPVSGMATIGADFDPADRLAHLVLPALILGLSYAAPLMRYTRSSMLDVLGQDYMVTAQAKGLGRLLVMRRHGLRNAILPLITLFGLMLPDLIGGAVITEQIFNWPGMGRLAVTASSQRDPSLMMGVMMLVAVGVVLSTLVADISYSVADPRVRLSRGR